NEERYHSRDCNHQSHPPPEVRLSPQSPVRSRILRCERRRHIWFYTTASSVSIKQLLTSGTPRLPHSRAYATDLCFVGRVSQLGDRRRRELRPRIPNAAAGPPPSAENSGG